MRRLSFIARPGHGFRKSRLEQLEDRLNLATTLPPGFAEVPVASGLASPTAMELAPDGRLFVLEQAGSVRVIKNGVLLPTPFLTFPEGELNSDGERGLLGIAFDPDFANNQHVYFYYTSNPSSTSALHNRVVRVTADPANGDVAAPGSEVPILELNDLVAFNHNGGAIHFGEDEKLYVAVGENGIPDNSQTLDNLLGKMLRINKDGSIPGDNPFFLSAARENRAIWALGLRNPFTFAVQPGTGRIFINDVGGGSFEEINEGVAGANYGWDKEEGFDLDNSSDFQDPIFAYGRPNASTPPGDDRVGTVIAGGAFYNPATPNMPRDFIGDYFFADFTGGWIRRLDTTTGEASSFATGLPFGTVDLKVTSGGSLLYLSITGVVNRIDFQSPWQNTANRANVNNDDDGVSVVDAVAIVNELILNGTRTLPIPLPAGSLEPPPFYDVDNDGSITVLDVIAVINVLVNPPPASPAGPASPAAASANRGAEALALAMEQDETDQAGAAAVASSREPSSAAPNARERETRSADPAANSASRGGRVFAPPARFPAGRREPVDAAHAEAADLAVLTMADEPDAFAG